MCVCIKCNSQIGYYLILVDNWVLNIGGKTLVQLALDSLIWLFFQKYWNTGFWYLILTTYTCVCITVSVNVFLFFFGKQNNYAVKVAFFLRNGSINTRYFFSTSFKISRRLCACGIFLGISKVAWNLFIKVPFKQCHEIFFKC